MDISMISETHSATFHNITLQQLAGELRKQVVDMIYHAGSGHCGGSLSAVEILTVLYFDKMNVNPKLPQWEDRDRFIASKGHCAPALYAALAKRGFFNENELSNLRKLGHFLQGHPDMKRIPGVDMSTGSLGLGLSTAIGMTLAGRLKRKNYYTYVLLGDGEHQEGQVWEAAMAAARFQLNRLIVIVDYNHVQLDGSTNEIMPLGDLRAKWSVFGWNTIEIDGHCVEEISQAIEDAKKSEDRPTVIIAQTIKGKGISFMENRHEWHGRPLNAEDYEKALIELGKVAQNA
jgi:transketolase